MFYKTQMTMHRGEDWMSLEGERVSLKKKNGRSKLNSYNGMISIY